jgi:hypothetical protein
MVWHADSTDIAAEHLAGRIHPLKLHHPVAINYAMGSALMVYSLHVEYAGTVFMQTIE